jgi:hypothetical protein
MFMMERASEPVWRAIPILWYLQFPGRFLTLMTITNAVLFALAFSYLRDRRVRLPASILCLSVVGWLGADTVAASQAYSRWRHIPPERVALAWDLERTEQEYLSMWPKPARMQELLPIPEFDKFVSAHPPKTAHLDVASGQVSVESWRPRRSVLKVNLPTSGHLTINHFYYEGLKAHQIETGAELPVFASTPDGLIEVNLPAGNYELAVELPPDRAERIGGVVSLASAGIVILLLAWARFGYRPSPLGIGVQA